MNAPSGLNVFRFFIAGALVVTVAGAAVDTSLAKRADAGNGGIAATNADGGLVEADDIDTGGKAGEVIVVGDSVGDVVIHAKSLSRSTEIEFTADGGLSVSDAAGSDGNVAGVTGR